MAKVNEGISKAASEIANLARKTKEGIWKALMELFEMFAEGGEKLKEFVEKLWKAIADWFLKNKKLVSLVTEADLQAFSKANRLKVTLQDIQTVLRLTQGKRELAEAILLSTQEIVERRTVPQLVKRFGIKEAPLVNSLSNYQARIWYTWRKMQIEKAISKISKLEDKAKKAFELRNEFRTATRQYMKDRKLAEYLEQVEKNQEWEKLLEKTLSKDRINSLEDAYNYIIETSKKGRDGVDKLFKIDK